MATISAPGVGSGLDVKSIVSQLLAIERRPIEQLQSAASRIQTQISAYGKLQSSLATLQGVVAKLTRADTWGAVTTASSRTDAVSASAAAGAPAGPYSVVVQQLASGQALASATYAERGAVVGQGTLRIELGHWDAVPPAPKADATPVEITIGPGEDTLEGIRDKINAAGAGVTASIVSDVNGSRLVIRSRDTGAENGFRVEVVDADGDDADASGLSALSFDPSGGASHLTRTRTATDALVEIDGLLVQSKSNTLPDVVGGLTLKLGRASPDPVEVTVGQDSASLRKTIEEFVTAYNEVVSLVRQQTKVDPGGTSSGPLQGDRAGAVVLSKLRELVGGSTSASAAFSRLADIGLDVQTDGTIKLVADKLDNAVANGVELRKLFATDDADPAADGFGRRFDDWLGLVLGSDGLLDSRTDGLQQRLKANQRQQERLQDRIALTEQRLLRQYTALDARLSQLNGLSAYMTQQIAQFNRSAD
ncbi:MAG: flagellar filament capping protein FliD [Rubrivivax sp.]|nr:flagellar filament capping protein FliD [Rubrivivax sp.]